MKDLIVALNIFLKYGDPAYPTQCQHDILIVNINPDIVSNEDKTRLKELGFDSYKGEPWFSSFRFGSC
jgi:hypothetical protein